MWQVYTMKIIIAVNYFRKTLHHRCLKSFWICLGFWICQRSEYTGVLNMPVLWICQGSGCTTVLNISGLHGSRNMPEYAWIILGYAWSCFFVKLKTLKMNSFTCILAKSLSNFVHDFCEDCFPKSKLLFAANRLVCLNISTIRYMQIPNRRPTRASYIFTSRLDTSGLKIRSGLKKF